MRKCKGLWFKVKKIWGHLKTIFAISGYCYPEVGNIFVNISVKTKIFSKIFLFSQRYSRKYFQLLGNNTRKLRKCSLYDPIFFGWNSYTYACTHRPQLIFVYIFSFKGVKGVKHSFWILPTQFNFVFSLPSIVTRKFYNIRETIPGNFFHVSLARNFQPAVSVT